MQNFPNIRALFKAVRAGKIPAAKVMLATEATERLGITRQSLDYALMRGRLDGWRVDHLVFIDSDTVAQYRKGERG